MTVILVNRATRTTETPRHCSSVAGSVCLPWIADAVTRPARYETQLELRLIEALSRVAL